MLLFISEMSKWEVATVKRNNKPWCVCDAVCDKAINGSGLRRYNLSYIETSKGQILNWIIGIKVMKV